LISVKVMIEIENVNYSNMDIKIRIFLFHRVSPQRNLLWNPMTPKLFEQIVVYLNNRYEIVPLEKTLTGQHKLKGEKELCAITFDDGYKDFIDYAFPILQKHKSPSSMYIVTDCADNNTPPWTYIINHLFINTSHISLDLKSKALPPSLKKINWRNSRERIAYAKKLSAFLKQLNNKERELIFEQIVKDFNDVEKPEGMMLSWDEIRYLHQNGCEIGSHSVSHPLLAKKSNVTEIASELTESGKIIEKQIGKFPIAISYPFGSYNDLTKKASQEAGYKVGITVNPVQFDSKKHNLFEVPRIELFDEPFLKSKLRMAGIIGGINNFLKTIMITGVFDY
jgi:peptidoglycan/xylan/chitin deacetylase (PgdA/CDA1 family)